MRRLCWCVLSCALVSACARNAYPPESFELDEPASRNSNPLTNHPIRRDYARVLRECDALRMERSADVSNAERDDVRQRRVENLIGGNRDATGHDGSGCSSDTPPYTTRPCNDQPPPTSAEASVTANVRHEFRRIDRTIDGLDERLIAKPDPDTWSDSERVSWRNERDELARLCQYDGPIPRL